MNDKPEAPALSADFNGLFRTDEGLILCLSHAETCRDADGGEVTVYEGMRAMAFDADVDDDGNPDNLIASGTVERPPEWLAHRSRWVLRIDDKGVRHESDDGPRVAD